MAYDSAMKKTLQRSLIAPIALLFAFALTSLAQVSPRGIELFDKGDMAGAIQALKPSRNFIDLNYLGQAYEKLGKEKDARDAYGRSFRAGYDFLAPDILVRSDFDRDRPAPLEKLSDFLTANKTEVLIAALSARRAFAMKASGMDEPEWAIRAKLFSEMAEILAAGGMIYSARELDKPAKGALTPRPSYPNRARAARENGTVRLLLLVNSEGAVKAILPTKSDTFGLTQASFLSAAKSKFTPAERANVPVAVMQAMLYSFHTN